MGAKTANDDSPSIDHDEDKRIKKELLIETITAKCASSSHEMMKKINSAVNEAGDGSKLEAIVLSGGYTNYSYKVFVDEHPELVIFAKLCFDFAMWNPNPDAHHDLKRTDNEYEIMKKISAHTPECVVAPIALYDLKRDGQQMKILVTEWSFKGDEQFCNQFMDGAVDLRIAPKIANTLATLHNIKDYDLDFNAQVNDCVQNLMEQMKQGVRERCNAQTPKDRVETYCTNVGEDVLMKSVIALVENCNKQDCLIHSDPHVFNTLVETKPSIEELEDFGPEGTVVLCDWEMAYVGPMGKDIGLVISWPVACMIAHFLNGHIDATKSILAYVNSVLDTYTGRLIEMGKTEGEIASILRNIFGWCGFFHYMVYYAMDCQTEFLPVESEEQRLCVREATGTLGLKLFRLAFDTDFVPESASTDEVRKVFDSLWEEEVARATCIFASGGRKKQPRKSSMLRATNRRVSDAAMFLDSAERVKRISSTGDDAMLRAVEKSLEASIQDRLSSSYAVGEYFAFDEQ